MANSLDLDPEWGAIDLLEEAEAAFGIKIANAEAEQCATVGDLYDVVCAHSPDWDRQDGSCGSSMVFYRIRRSLGTGDQRRLGPDTPLATCGLQPSRLFKQVADDTALRLPSYDLTWIGIVGSFLLVVGILVTIVALLTGNLIFSAAAAAIALVGVPLLRVDPGRFPAGIETIADLVRRTVPLNASKLKEAGGRPADRWSVLAALAAEHGVLQPHEIGPETVFHRKQLKKAEG
jgi:hypothetical protein